MFRIVGVQHAETPDSELVLIQNHGSMREALRGMAVISESSVDAQGGIAHVFNDYELIPPGGYVLLISGTGYAGWGKSSDGTNVYHVFMNRRIPAWVPGEPLNLLKVQHSFVPRSSGDRRSSSNYAPADASLI